VVGSESLIVRSHREDAWIGVAGWEALVPARVDRGIATTVAVARACFVCPISWRATTRTPVLAVLSCRYNVVALSFGVVRKRPLHPANATTSLDDRGGNFHIAPASDAETAAVAAAAAAAAAAVAAASFFQQIDGRHTSAYGSLARRIGVADRVFLVGKLERMCLEAFFCEGFSRRANAPLITTAVVSTLLPPRSCHFPTLPNRTRGSWLEHFATEIPLLRILMTSNIAK
jgi:hypothetical protein